MQIISNRDIENIGLIFSHFVQLYASIRFIEQYVASGIATSWTVHSCDSWHTLSFKALVIMDVLDDSSFPSPAGQKLSVAGKFKVLGNFLPNI